MMQTHAQSASSISKWVLAWADAKAEIRSRTGEVAQLAELDRLMAELIDLMLATQSQNDASLEREWSAWNAASDQDLKKFEAVLEANRRHGTSGRSDLAHAQAIT